MKKAIYLVFFLLGATSELAGAAASVGGEAHSSVAGADAPADDGVSVEVMPYETYLDVVVAWEEGHPGASDEHVDATTVAFSGPSEAEAAAKRFCFRVTDEDLAGPATINIADPKARKRKQVMEVLREFEEARGYLKHEGDARKLMVLAEVKIPALRDRLRPERAAAVFSESLERDALDSQLSEAGHAADWELELHRTRDWDMLYKFKVLLREYDKAPDGTKICRAKFTDPTELSDEEQESWFILYKLYRLPAALFRKIADFLVDRPE